MESSVNEDQEQRINTGMEDSNAMTIDFLRARLLSERSVSKTARQRADELSKRVAELEEQLKFVSLQRKKAEKATSDVLAILENRGISDFSEGFDSCSDQDENPHEFEVHKKDSSTNMRVNKNEMEAYSSSELEYSPSIGRTLSWKSSKDSQYSLEKKKYMESVRRRASFASSGSSSKRVGKSCRRIRRRETKDGPEIVACSRNVSNCSDTEPYELRESAGYDNEKNPLENRISGSNNEDMESALRHQAKLIGQYEAEEKAQRDWEEKFRENNSGTQDSCDPGNHSDVTEERYEIKSPEPLSTSETLNSNNNQETKQEPSKAQPSLPVLQDEKPSGTIACESSAASEFSFPTSKNNNELELSRTHHENELALLPQETSNNLGSVLEALQQAKLSLNQKLNSSAPVITPNSESHNVDKFRVPFSPGLFRLPTENQFSSELYVDSRSASFGQSSSFANIPTEMTTSRFVSEPFLDVGNAHSGALYRTSPARPLTTGIGSGDLPQRSMSHIYTNPVLFSDTNSYPFLPNVTPRLPFNEGTSRTFRSSETGLPHVTRLSSYDDFVRTNMKR
ncbi:hypothetical protein ACJIZ3_022811 [Penstemon smallii]|uniref:Uncharacterized protein n=1 Tax=Penstemon smallii TaxID=265156 RepID=A0ABD3TMF4_9LAMI